ncbi:MAG: hypothetical protein R2730_05295 [Chitinophagales bacterium]
MTKGKNLAANILISTIAVLLALFVGEMALRKMGYKAGYKKSYTGFAEVDSLIVYQNYTTDEFGNYVLSPMATDSFMKYYNFRTNSVQNKDISDKINLGVDNYIDVIKDFSLLYHHSNCAYDFSCFIQQLEHSDQLLDDADSAYLDYVKKPFNQDGFRSVAFKNYTSEKVKVLLIGDSFTWGMSANPFYASFADQLAARGYLVYNAGISSTDPAQYSSIYKKYHAVLNPDITIINVFEGNDLMDFYRNPKMGEPHEHVTNGGFYVSNPEGKYLNAEDAYVYYVKSVKIPKTNLVNRIAAKTAISSLAWYAFYGKKGHSYGSNLSHEEKAEISHHYLGIIDSIANSNKELVVYALIPDVNSNYNKGRKIKAAEPKIIDPLFENMEYYEPNDLIDSDFNLPDIHFNNSGMKKYADFLDEIIKAKLKE